MPSFFEYLVYAQSRNLPGPGKFEYTDFVLGPGSLSFLYTPQNRNLPGPGKFEYTDFAREPGPFELSVYASEQEHAWALKN